MSNSKGIETVLDRRIENVFPSRDNAVRRLQEETLEVYLGIDPTSPELHLGHTVPLLFLKNLHELGHKIIILIGDFTARIGDPTGKESARKALSGEEIEANMKTYLKQVHRILPSGSFEVKYNSTWLEPLNFGDLIKLASNVTVQQMIVRDMFQERIKQEKPIYLHEFLYPLAQGYDSVAMKVDGEVGGNDQTFNMLVGRELEKTLLQKEKLVFATKLITNREGGKKMSKSEGEVIALTDEPQEIRRKVLALDDGIIASIFQLCTEKDMDWIREQNSDPRAFKEALAEELIAMYHG
ncbi:MAG: tyrosine--tRNA ligase, partial [Candidatus Yanofskybacteria bacterium]|nr:tyrosine--tRNA ligase [Candidatus Yanofskybacteria bacterium]